MLRQHTAQPATLPRRCLLPRPQRSRGRPARPSTQARAIRIDRRQHLDLAWQRQNARDQWLADLQHSKPHGVLVEVQDLEQLEQLMEWAGNSLVVVCFYSRSCGACKSLLACFHQLCNEAKAQQVRAVFARHNIINEFDDPSDISRWHKVRAVPCLCFYDQGALVKKVTLRDVRRMGGASKAQIQQAMADDLALLKAVFRQMVFQTAPGARP